MAKLIDLTNQTFGNLTVIRKSTKDEYHIPAWLCQCTCGTEKHIPGFGLRHGHYKSCGCKHATKRDAGVRKHIEIDRANGTRKTALKAKLHVNNSSGVKGVRFNQQRGKWTAHIGFKGKQINLGYFLNFDDAVAARKQAEEIHHKPILEDARN